MSKSSGCRMSPGDTLLETALQEFPETSDSLIAQVRDPNDREAWERFEQIYRPVIFRIARRCGLQHSDSLDLVQQVLLSVSAAIGRYESTESGPPFRHWLSRITKNAVLKALSRGPRERAAGGSEILDALHAIPSADTETEELIETEYRREVYAIAASVVRSEVEETTWLAFELSVLQSQSIQRVAGALELSTGSVYAARSRVMRSPLVRST
ncbi:MAG: sigma-70 family RNA polymerase sigma factor [Planctomycetota bacterium]